MDQPETFHSVSLPTSHVLQNAFDSAVEQSAGIGDHGIVEMGHYLSDLSLEGCFSVVRAFVYLHHTNAHSK